MTAVYNLCVCISCSFQQANLLCVRDVERKRDRERERREGKKEEIKFKEKRNVAASSFSSTLMEQDLSEAKPQQQRLCVSVTSARVCACV